MKLLVDTHVLIWGFNDPDRLPSHVRDAIASDDNQAFVSVVSLWEIAIKTRSGRLDAPENLPDLVRANPDFELLPITADHAWRVKTLPRLHADPFDHLLVAQALVEEMIIVTHDRMVGRYGVPIMGV